MDAHAQLDALTRGIEALHSRDELLKRLQEGRPLRVKLGVDPTTPDLHLGHTVALAKLRQFQDFGHHAVLIIGAFTARIGDPTGRNTTRPQLDAQSIRANAETYQVQAFKVLDRDRTEVVWNDAWFQDLSFDQVIRLLARRTVAQMLQRRDFKERMAAGHDVSMHELVYPLLQGWDSVEVRSDVELGGSDQLFNLLVGRDMQQQEGLTPQICMTLPLLEGLDGSEKMSKSLGNYIGITDPPSEMFGKVMSISDDLMKRWNLVLFSEELDPAAHPMESKKQLAARIVARFHDSAAAEEARAGWDKQFSQGEVPDEMPQHSLSGQKLWELLKSAGICESSSDARRLIKQGGVSRDGAKLTDENLILTEPCILKCGKRHWLRLV